VSRAHKNEGVSSAQLLLALAGLASEGAALDEANAKLRAASEIDHQGAGEPETEEPAPQPPHRKRPSKELRRIENRILVPEAERACPRCGGVRECIGHDVTEVIDLIPAEIVVRLDLREKLACRPCDGEVARAPQGDKVVSGDWSRSWSSTSMLTACRCIDRGSASAGWASSSPSRRSPTK